MNAPNTTELLLNNNLIDDVPLEVGALLKLKLIDVSCNDLQSMPTGLGYLPDLTRIVYAGNPCEVGGRCGTILAGRSKNEAARHLKILFIPRIHVIFCSVVECVKGPLIKALALLTFEYHASLCANHNPRLNTQVRLGTRSSEDLKRFMRTRGPPHPALKEAGIEVEDESDASGKLMAKAKKLLASGMTEREWEIEFNVVGERDLVV